MKQKHLSIVVIGKLVALLLFFSACGNTNTEQTDDSDASGTEELSTSSDQHKGAFEGAYKGTLGKSTQLMLDLTDTGGKITGQYLYISVGAPLKLTEKSRSGSSITLEEINHLNQVTGVFTLNQDGDNLTGTWQSPDGSKEYPISLSPNTADALEFEEWSANNDNIKKDYGVSAAFDFSVDYLHLSTAPSIPVLLALRDSINKYCLDVQPSTDKPAYAGDLITKDQFGTYIKQVFGKSTPPPSYPIDNWSHEQHVSTTYNAKNMVCFSFSYWGMYGGAHGMGVSSYKVYDLQTGKLITAKDIFKDPNSKDLGNMIAAKIRESFEAEPNTPLTGLGLYEDEVKANNNIYITQDGIGFSYNSYELAPYSVPPIDVFFTFNEVRSLFRSDCKL